MRDILFKAKDSFSGNWVFGTVELEFYPDGSIRCARTRRNKILRDVDYTTISEFIGMKTIHGEKIFENDEIILENENEKNVYTIQYSKNEACYKVLRNKGKELEPYKYLYEIDLTELRIVGNHFDNPLFFEKTLNLCTTEEELEEYFKENSVSEEDYERKRNLLEYTMDVDFMFPSSFTTERQKYHELVRVFLTMEWKKTS
ncbi:MAG: YopX family protein [Bacteroidales bacterium]